MTHEARNDELLDDADDRDWRERAAQSARTDLGWSYEQIARNLTDWIRPLGGEPTTPTQAYKYVNPQKTAAQVAAWEKKHHPS